MWKTVHNIFHFEFMQKMDTLPPPVWVLGKFVGVPHWVLIVQICNA